MLIQDFAGNFWRAEYFDQFSIDESGRVRAYRHRPVAEAGVRTAEFKEEWFLDADFSQIVPAAPGCFVLRLDMNNVDDKCWPEDPVVAWRLTEQGPVPMTMHGLPEVWVARFPDGSVWNNHYHWDSVESYRHSIRQARDFRRKKLKAKSQ